MRWCLFAILLAAGCGHHHLDQIDAGSGSAPPPPDAACTAGLACFQVDCAPKNLPPTSLSGTVYAPNGTLPLYGVNVYVPAADPGPLTTGVTCDKCSDALPGGSLTSATTDEAGHFTLLDVPATGNVPVVIQVGKWRRQLVIPQVAACQDTPVATVDTTLPKSRSDASPETAVDAGTGAPKVDLPYIAITTGAFDALECLVLKLGVDPSEITNDTGGGHVQLYANAGAGAGHGEGANQFVAGWAGGSGASFGDAQALWATTQSLSRYDITMFSCEGGQYATTKPQSAMQAVHDYASAGGRVFMSHWHNIWIGGEGGTPSHGLADWESVATFDYDAPEDQDDTIASVDESSQAKGSAFATWLVDVGASTTRDQIPISEARYTLASNDPAQSERWAYIDPALPITNSHTSVQDLQFTTPLDQPEGSRCGKVVFSDMHVASGSTSSSSVPYPGGCAMTDLTPQEKALAFIFFDIESCVGVVQ
nr:hypothetical protein [Kofleriaceae bacterium]